MNNVCRDCMLNKHLDHYPEGTPEEVVKHYQEAVIRLTGQSGAVPTGPEVFFQVRALRKELFGEGEPDFTEIKRHFNALMLGLEEKVGMYEKMGFRDLGFSGFVRGGEPWHEMEIRLDR